MCEIISNANDLAERNNTWRPSNWKKSSSKSYYPNPQPGQFLVLILKMIRPETTSCFGCRKNIRTLQIQPQMGLYEGSRCLVVTVGRAQSVMHKDFNGALQYATDLRNFYIDFNERCIFRTFPYFNGRMFLTCNQQKQFLPQFQMDFLYRFGFKRVTFFS